MILLRAYWQRMSSYAIFRGNGEDYREELWGMGKNIQQGQFRKRLGDEGECEEQDMDDQRGPSAFVPTVPRRYRCFVLANGEYSCYSSAPKASTLEYLQDYKSL